jgi:hypothetical protein
VQKEADVLTGVIAVVMSGGGSSGSGGGLALLGLADSAGGGRSVAELETLVKLLGGEVDKNVTIRTTHIIDADNRMGGRVAREVARLRQAASTGGAGQPVSGGGARASGGGTQVVTASWLDACHRERARVPLEPKYVRYANAQTAEAVAARMDTWGDRYAELADLSSMREAMGLVRRERLARRDLGDGAGAPMLGMEQGAQGQGERQAGPAPTAPQRGASFHSAGVPRDVSTAVSPSAPPFTASVLEDAVASALRSLHNDSIVKRLRTRYALLRGTTVYAPASNTALRLRLRLLAARLLDAPVAEATHVALPSTSSPDERRAVRAALRDAMVSHYEEEGAASAHEYLVSERWLDQCERACARVEELPEAQWFDG